MCRGMASVGYGALREGEGEGGSVQRPTRLTYDKQDQGFRSVDLVPIVLPSKDGFGYTRDVCAECWTVRNGGDRSVPQRRKRGWLTIWGLLDRTSTASEVHRRHKRVEGVLEEKKRSVGGFGRSSGLGRPGRR